MIVASDAAAVRLPPSMKLSTRTDTASVLNGSEPLSSTSDPYSEIARANESAAPAAIGRDDGRQHDPAQDGGPARPE